MFYSSIFDPWLIVAQMGVLQTSFYLTVGLWLTLFGLIFGSDMSLASMLQAGRMDVSRSYGWPPILAYLLVTPVR